MKTTSVIIATYNGERFIEEQLDSIATQTVWPTEVIISDDGSKDNTIEVINNWLKSHDEFSKVVTLISNMTIEHGYLANFENALLHAQGDYVFFCDQDDVWCENKVEEMLSIIEEINGKVFVHNTRVLLENIDGTFSLQKETLFDGRQFESGYYKYSKTDLKQRMFYCAMQGNCMVAEREYLLSLVPFSRGYGHDNWIQFCATADESIIAVEKVLSYYRIHKNNFYGLQKYNLNKNRSLNTLIHKVLDFEKTTIKAITKQTVWWIDCFEYASIRNLEQYLYFDNKEEMVQYFAFTRRKNLEKGKIQAIISLKQAKNNGMYHWDGIRMYLHEMAFILIHTRTKRRELLSDIDIKTRNNSFNR